MLQLKWCSGMYCAEKIPVRNCLIPPEFAIQAKPALRLNFMCSVSIPPCVKEAHALICLSTPTLSSQVSIHCRNLDYFASSSCNPIMIPYAEKQQSSLTGLQLLTPTLAPFTCLYIFTPHPWNLSLRYTSKH